MSTIHVGVLPHTIKMLSEHSTFIYLSVKFKQFFTGHSISAACKLFVKRFSIFSFENKTQQQLQRKKQFSNMLNSYNSIWQIESMHQIAF